MDMDKFQATTCEESCHPMVLYIGDCFAQALSQHMIGKGSFVILPTWGKDIRRSVDSLLEEGTMKTSEAPSLESKLKRKPHCQRPTPTTDHESIDKTITSHHFP
jgi:hypothetical protein